MSSNTGKSQGRFNEIVEMLLRQRGESDASEQPLLGEHLNAIIDPHGKLAKEVLEKLADELDEGKPPTS